MIFAHSDYIISFFLALAVNVILTPLIIYLAHKFHWLDPPSKRKIHTSATPRLGGLTIFIVTCGGLLIWASQFIAAWSFTKWQLVGLGVALLIIYGTGLADDFINMVPHVKLATHCIAAFIIIGVGLRIESIVLPFFSAPIELGLVSYPFTFFWIIICVNSFNLIDGLDGLAGGIATIIFFVLICVIVIYAPLLSWGAEMMFTILCGALVGFLCFNFHPAKIFMGDSGSLFLGFVISLVPILHPDIPALSLMPIATLLMVPLLDTCISIVRRIRAKQSIYRPDRFHIHHVLLNLGLNKWQVCVVLFLLTAICGGSLILWAQLNSIVGDMIWTLVWIVGLIVMIVPYSIHRRKVGKVPRVRTDGEDQ